MLASYGLNEYPPSRPIGGYGRNYNNQAQQFPPNSFPNQFLFGPPPGNCFFDQSKTSRGNWQKLTGNEGRGVSKRKFVGIAEKAPYSTKIDNFRGLLLSTKPPMEKLSEDRTGNSELFPRRSIWWRLTKPRMQIPFSLCPECAETHNMRESSLRYDTYTTTLVVRMCHKCVYNNVSIGGCKSAITTNSIPADVVLQEHTVRVFSLCSYLGACVYEFR